MNEMIEVIFDQTNNRGKFHLSIGAELILLCSENRPEHPLTWNRRKISKYMSGTRKLNSWLCKKCIKKAGLT